MINILIAAVLNIPRVNAHSKARSCGFCSPAEEKYTALYTNHKKECDVFVGLPLFQAQRILLHCR
jgi:hypothetical protein